MKQNIALSRALAEINTPPQDGGPDEVAIGWIRKTKNDKRGSSKHVARCRRTEAFSPGGQKKPATSAGDDKKATYIRNKFTLFLYDLDGKNRFRVGIETIIAYNGYDVDHTK